MSDIEARVREALSDPVWTLPVPADPAAWARQRAGRRRLRRRAAPLAAAGTAAVAIAAVLVPAVLQPAQDTPPEAAWQRLPDPPLTARQGSVAAWTGTEALFLGGEVGAPCPPGADCVRAEPPARDGAAYDPASGTWRSTAPSPVDLPSYAVPAVLGDRVHLLIDDAVVVYDASDDAWSSLPHPPGPVDGFWSLTAVDDRIVALRQRQAGTYYADQVYDPAAGGWSALPRDPLVPAFARQITATPQGLVLTGKAEVAQPNSQRPSVVRAAVLDPASGQWRQLPDSDQLGGATWTWTGRRMVDPALGGADGGQVNGFGRTVPYGGTFDPATGAWGRLPNAPEELTGRWQAYAISGPQVASDGYLYDDANETWTRIERPEGAPERPGAAVWAGDELIVFGGFSDDDGYVVEGLSNQAFRYGRSAAPDTGPVLVPGGSVAVVLQDGTLGHVDDSGQVEQLAQLPDDVGEPDAVAVDPSGRVVLVSAVSSDDDDASVCQAVVLQAKGRGKLRRIADGASLALSADGRQLAYFRYATVDGYCRRTSLVVRDLGTGAERVVTELVHGPVGSTPPGWPVNWSPDGDEIAHVVDEGAVVTDVSTGATRPTRRFDGSSALAPGWLPEAGLVVLEGCCIGGASARSVADGDEVFAVPGPLRSLRAGRDGSGAWLTVEEGGLLRWDGRTLRRVVEDAVLSSG